MDVTEKITPIVLCGGRSRRFGRDKLREVLPDGSWLIDRAIGVLRGVFGRRVKLVGECDAALAARGDGVIVDRYLGKGPAAGILSALEETGESVFVLAGDLPTIHAGAVRAVLAGAAVEPAAVAVLGAGPEVEPCIGLYRAGAAEYLRAALSGERPGALRGAIPAEACGLVAIDRRAGANANTPEELAALLRGKDAAGGGPNNHP